MTLGWWAGTIRPGEWSGPPGGAAGGSATRPDTTAAWSIFSDLQARLAGPTNSNARSQWYERAFARDDGALTVYYSGVGRARGSVMVSIRQSWFEQCQGDPVPLVAGLTGGWHVSRLDLAADARTDDRCTPARLYSMLPTARSRSRAEHRTLQTDWAGNEKLTIGSRVSPRYGRIYVKGDRVRHEIELKQDAAGLAWRRLVDGETALAVWAGEYGRLVQWSL